MKLSFRSSIITIVVIFITVAALWFSTRTSAPITIPNCYRLHAGNTYTQIQSDPKLFVTEFDTVPGSTPSGILLFKRGSETNPDKFYVFTLREGQRVPDSVEHLLSIAGKDMGPVFDKRGSVGGVDAVYASSSANNFRYYHVPFGNRIIDIDYIWHQVSVSALTPAEKKKADEIFQHIKIYTAPTDLKGPPVVEQCTEGALQTILAGNIFAH